MISSYTQQQAGIFLDLYTKTYRAMKKKVVFAIALMVLAIQGLLAQQQARIEQILTKEIWYLDLKSVIDDLEQKYPLTDTERLSAAQRQEREEAFLELSVYRSVTLTYKKDGTYSVAIRGSEQDYGRWRVEDNGKTLATYDNWGQPKGRFTIQEINEKRLIALEENGNAAAYVPESVRAPVTQHKDEYPTVWLEDQGASNVRGSIFIRHAPDGKSFKVFRRQPGNVHAFMGECLVERTEDGFETGICKGSGLTASPSDDDDYWEGSTIAFYNRDPKSDIYLFGYFRRPVQATMGNTFHYRWAAAPTTPKLDNWIEKARVENTHERIMGELLHKWYIGK
jgi:hypothetical protein